MRTLSLLALLLPLSASAAKPKAPTDFFKGRKALYDCRNDAHAELRFYEAQEKKSLPPGLAWKLDGKELDVDLDSNEVSGRKVSSQVFRYDGFTKIVRKTEYRDPKTKQAKAELVKVLIDEDPADPKHRTFTATLELFEGDDTSKPLRTEKLGCTKKD